MLLMIITSRNQSAEAIEAYTWFYVAIVRRNKI